MSTQKNATTNDAMKTFRQAAKDSMSMSRLHEGREKVETEDILGQPLTISDFDLACMTDGTVFGVFTFEELDGKYYNGGLILTKMVSTWVEMYGTLDDAVAAYQSEKEKVVIQLTLGKTKDKSKSLVSVEIM